MVEAEAAVGAPLREGFTVTIGADAQWGRLGLGLSPLLVEEMFALIQRINREGQSILLMEQNAVQTLAIAHRGYIIENGRVAMQGVASELARDPELRKNYLGL